MRVNEDVDNSLFTLSTSGVEHIYDIDEYERRMATIKAEEGETPAQPMSFGRMMLIFINGVVVVAIIAFVVVRRRLSQR